MPGLPDPRWDTAADVGPGAICGAWAGHLPEPQRANAAVGPGPSAGPRGGQGMFNGNGNAFNGFNGYLYSISTSYI